MRVRVFLFLAVALATATGDALAQSRIEGVVRRADGAPAAGITVELDGASKEYRKPLTVTTAEDGSYRFENIIPGSRVRLRAMQDGKPFARGFALVTLWVEKVDLEERIPSSIPNAIQDVRASEGPSSQIAGIVRTADGTPIPEARILIDRTTWSVGADDTGRYAFGGLKPGMRVQLVASAPGYSDSTSQEVLLPEGRRVPIDFTLERESAAQAQESAIRDPDDEHTIHRPAPPGAGRVHGESGYVVSVPTPWPDDTFRSVQFVPSVNATLERAEDMYVHGGTPDQTLVTYDGMTLYQFPHTLASLTPFNMSAVGRADVWADPFDAAGGGRLSGALRLTGRGNPENRTTGNVEVSYLGAGGGFSAPLGKRGSILFAMRHSPPTSVYDDVLDLFADLGSENAPSRLPRYSDGVFRSVQSSVFHDVNARVELGPTDNDRFSISFYDAQDDRRHMYDLAAPAQVSTVVPTGALVLPADAAVQTSALTSWDARGFAGSYSRRWSPAASTNASFGRTEYSGGGERAWLLTSPLTGKDYSIEAGRGGSSAITEANSLTDNTFHVDTTMLLGFAHAMTFGGDVASFDTVYASQTEALVASGALFTSRLVPLFGHAASGTQVTLFAQDAWRVLPVLTIVPGVRFVRFGDADATHVDPRVSGWFQLTPTVRLKGGWAIDHQMVNRITREDRLHGDGEFWALADGLAVLVPRSEQVAAGAVAEVRGAMLDVQAYYRTLENLTLFAPRLFPGETPGRPGTMLHYGTGRASGIDGHFRYEVPRNSLRGSYTFSRVEYTYPTLEAATFPGSQDQRSEFKAADTMRFGPWSVGAAMVIGSGRPFTAATSIGQVWYPSGASVYAIGFGAKNSARLDPYHRLDVSGEREFKTGRLSSRIGAAVLNVYDQENVAFVDYETATDAVVANNVLLMGRVVNVYFRVGF